MFELIWDLTRGPRWWRVTQLVLLVAAVVAVLVLVVYPAVYEWRQAAIAI